MKELYLLKIYKPHGTTCAQRMNKNQRQVAGNIKMITEYGSGSTEWKREI